MTQEYVRVCPVCGMENPVERSLCACGASLDSVDFSLKAQVPEPPAETAAPQAPPAATLTCPHADCGQANPPGQERCLYCNRPLAAQAAAEEPAGDTRFSLPSALRQSYRVLEVFPATGSEADLVLVESGNGERRVAKLYRKGLRPDAELLSSLNGASHVVRQFEHGISDGYAYELMEYCAHGTLRELLDAGPMHRESLRRLVAELAAAIGEIHERHILHRDLKPENILLRAIEPLQLVLTDFGISSLQHATQHFTTLARTVKYAAPEALTGMLDEKADWWSMGMMVLEAATGRHPFDGLSDPVINHHLATRPIDVRPVFDDELRKLCRGLLLRDPKRRWGGAEVARWLAGDASLEAPEDGEAAVAHVRPYHLGESECSSAAELALALATHWEEGCKDLRRGTIGAWLEQQLNDFNLARALRDILEQRDISDDYRLLRFILAAAPDMPAVWRGKPLGVEAVLAMAGKALADDKDAQAWLESVAEEEVLEAFDAAGAGELAGLGQRWRDGWNRFGGLWEIAHRAEEAWLALPKSTDGDAASAYVDIDEVMYSRPLRLALPSRRSQNARLLLALHDPNFAEDMRAEVLAALGEIAEYCPWFAAVGDVARLDPAGLLVARQLLPFAKRDAEQEKKRRGDFHGNRELNIASVRDEIEGEVRQILEAGKQFARERSFAHELSGALAGFQLAASRAMGYAYTEDSYRRLLSMMKDLSERGYALDQALNSLEHAEEVNAIFLHPYRLAIGLAILAFCYTLISPWAALAGGVAMAIYGAIRWNAATSAALAVDEALQAFARQARAFPTDTRPPGN